jgi:DNA-binding winged helix-turn-helix (wHTH) protein
MKSPPAQRPANPPRCLRFGVFEADLNTRELRKLGKLLPLQGQPFQLLTTLLEQPGELVTREELQAILWPQAVVDFDHGLNKAVSKIRDVLGDSAENPRFIQTVARRGYRFLADVTVVGRVQEKPESSSTVQDPPAAAVARKNPRSRLAAWAVAGLVLVLVLWAALPRLTSSFKSTSAPVRSLAVLPLTNLSEDVSQEYFADGMTDELITELAQISALRVISRSSIMNYKHSQTSCRDRP